MEQRTKTQMPQKTTGPRVFCTSCGDIIQSTYCHDFRWCSCRSISIDGGASDTKMSVAHGAKYIFLTPEEEESINAADKGPARGKVLLGIRKKYLEYLEMIDAFDNVLHTVTVKLLKVGVADAQGDTITEEAAQAFEKNLDENFIPVTKGFGPEWPPVGKAVRAHRDGPDLYVQLDLTDPVLAKTLEKGQTAACAAFFTENSDIQLSFDGHRRSIKSGTLTRVGIFPAEEKITYPEGD